MFDLILALVALGILVTVHEAGHFIAARLCGVKVEAFSIGFGKPLFRFTKNETEYRISWIPLGGYVKMKGESLEEDSPHEADSFQYATWWKKAIIAASGPIFNLILAIVIFVFAFMLPTNSEDMYPVVGKASGEYSALFAPGDTILTANETPVKGWYQFVGALYRDKNNTIKLVREGTKITITVPQINPESFMDNLVPFVPAIIGDVNPGMPAWRAGLKPGDEIVMIDTIRVSDWHEMRKLISEAASDSVLLTLKRGNSLFMKQLPLESNPLSDTQRLIGISQSMPVSYSQSQPPLKALKYGVTATYSFIVINYVGLYKVISKPETLKSSVGGPVMLYSMSSQSARKGWSTWIIFVAAISLVLMIMNLLPIPVLDGGHIMFALIQGITGKPLPRKVQIVLQNIGMILLLLLMAYAFYNDFSKVLTRAVSTMGKP